MCIPLAVRARIQARPDDFDDDEVNIVAEGYRPALVRTEPHHKLVSD